MSYQHVGTAIKCSDCGKSATVLFKPTPGKLVYCRKCIPKHMDRSESRGRIDDPSMQKQAWSRRRTDWKKPSNVWLPLPV